MRARGDAGGRRGLQDCAREVWTVFHEGVGGRSLLNSESPWRWGRKQRLRCNAAVSAAIVPSQ